ncbi:MAG: hypothetical protein R3F61_03935 [Myxococcota bacterium]
MSREALSAAIREVVQGDLAALDDVLLRVHAWQHANDPVLRALIAEPATRVDAIPAVPVALFRELDVGTVRPDEPHQAFHTSGTTVGRPGIHRMRDTALYDLGCRTHAARWLPSTTQTFGLMADSPHSSLAHMVRDFADRTGPVRFLISDTLDLEALSAIDAPTFVCATAFALDAWLQASPRPLPSGSCIMVTGGFKGRVHALEADALLDAAAALAPVLLEYGMTELSSQLWARHGEPYTPPPWLRVTAVEPTTGAALPPGVPGQLRFLDLCNLDGTLHVETLDEGVVHADGRVTLHGRLPDAPARGCSLAVEDLL